MPAQLLSQALTGFGVWVGAPFKEADRTRFVARYIDRGSIALEYLTVQDDIKWQRWEGSRSTDSGTEIQEDSFLTTRLPHSNYSPVR